MTNFSAMAMALKPAGLQSAQAKVKPAKQAGKKKGGTIAASIVAGLRAGREPQAVLAAVLKKHQSKTTIACVYWYASRIKRGLIKE